VGQVIPLILQSPAFAGLPVIHGFTTRIEGVSPAPFNSLNFSTSKGDKQENVTANERILLKHLNLQSKPIVTTHQVHGKVVLHIDDTIQIDSTILIGENDAIITMRKGIIIGIKTADCTPILVYDGSTGAIAAIHAGWKGTALRTAAHAIESMKSRFGSKPGSLKAVIGPCIGKCCYVIGDEVINEFEKTFGGGSFIIRAGDDGGKRFTADLQGANRQVLVDAGVPASNIFNINLCTACNPGLLFSHRRDAGMTGRHLNYIGRI